MSFRGDAQTVEQHIAYIYEQLRRLQQPGVTGVDDDPFVPLANYDSTAALLLGTSTPGMPGRLTPTADGDVLTLDSTQSLGAKWAPGGGGGGPWAATFIVAASDSQHPESADFVCDGVDDQVEINDALALLPNRGGRVLLLEGTFNITGSILMHGWHQTLQGQGHGLDSSPNRLNSTGGGGGTRLLVPNQTNTKFPIISDGVYTTGPDAHGTDFSGLVYIKQPVNNEGGHSFGVQGLVIRDLLIDGNGFNQTVTTANFNHGIFLSNFDACLITNIGVMNCSGCGIIVEWSAGLNAGVISDSWIQDCFVHGIVGYGNPGDGVTLRIAGNMIVLCGADAPNGDSGGDIFGAPYGGGIFILGNGGVVQNNFVALNSGDGIRCDAYNCLIQDNQLKLNGAQDMVDTFAEIRITNGPVMVSGNMMYPAYGVGIWVQAVSSFDPPTQDIAVIGNFIYGAWEHGIYGYGWKFGCIRDNEILYAGNTNSYDGIHLTGSVAQPTDSLSIMGNRVHLGSLGYGLILDTNTIDNWAVHNDLRNSGTTASYQDNGTTNDNTSTGNLV